MSRTTALWSAAALTLLFALVLGAVVLRPVLTANADGDGGISPINILSDRSGDDDDEYEHESYEDEDYDDEYDDDDDYEDEDDDHDDDEHGEDDEDDDD